MTESVPTTGWKERLEKMGRFVMAIIVASRTGFGFNLPFFRDGSTLKENALQELGHGLKTDVEQENNTKP